MTAFTTDIEVNLADVYVITSASTNPEDVTSAVAQASVLVETVSGVPTKADERDQHLSVSDAAWLRKAIVFQAAWILDNPGSFSRAGVSSLSQDGVSVSAPDSLTFVLAPLAKRALNNASWAKSGTLRVAPSTSRLLATDPTVSDAHGGWVTL